MKTISLKLPEDLLADLKREAKVNRVSQSALVRESVEKLAGMLKGLPRDLATNPKYMAGFGE